MWVVPSRELSDGDLFSIYKSLRFFPLSNRQCFGSFETHTTHLLRLLCPSTSRCSELLSFPSLESSFYTSLFLNSLNLILWRRLFVVETSSATKIFISTWMQIKVFHWTVAQAQLFKQTSCSCVPLTVPPSNFLLITPVPAMGKKKWRLKNYLNTGHLDIAWGHWDSAQLKLEIGLFWEMTTA